MKALKALVALFLFTSLVNKILAQDQPTVAIIPRPASLEIKKGVFVINPSTQIVLEGSGLENSANFLNDYLQKFYGFSLQTTQKATQQNAIVLNFERLNYPIAGAYKMDVNSKRVSIAGDNEEGVFYGIQTLIQLLDVVPSTSLTISQVKIEDHPRFQWRGLHLDVGRHFFSVDFIKRYIDFIALHKMNYFHWHLTDDQGWRIEIKRYPKLTEIGSCRDSTLIGHAGEGKAFDNVRYCGYYTQEQVKEVIKYAATRYVTIIPEIEMPGHASAALAAYPFLGCTGGPYHVEGQWGVFNDVYCAGNDSTFQFLQDVLDEVMALFPSKYIHIGGDECPKTAWEACPKCQRRIKENNLKDEHELQSYFIRRIEKYINSKGRQIIGWDEILEGGLAPNAAVMSWRGEAGGIAAAKQHHTVVMTPTTYVYFDYSQKKNDDSLVIGGFLPLEKVYNYEPLPKELTPEEQKYIIGAQANVWTEYMPSESKLEYMIFPRLSALSEVLWTPKELKDWHDFERRLPTQMARYRLWNVSFSNAFYDLKASILPGENNHGLRWKLESNMDPKKSVIRYFVDSRNNNHNRFLHDYIAPVQVESNLQCWAGLYEYSGNGQVMANPSTVAQQYFFFSKATGKKIALSKDPVVQFPGNGGAFGLVNGAVTENPSYSSEWLGWYGDDMEAVIDLGQTDTVSSVIVHTKELKRGRYYAPVFVEASTSLNGKDFNSVGKGTNFQASRDNMGNMQVSFSPVNARYIKVFAKNYGTIEKGQPGAGNPARMLIDEIFVN
ncbi:MAG: beta-N-acetylhexosaminidase [Bacteroidetes bacterium]|nr:MAG: beta-N-acetylhexosaminidase [Bacteroidota bacterium]